MSQALLTLEDFEDEGAAPRAITRSQDDWERERSAAFAEGFESGRSFAARAQEEADAETRRQIVQALQEIDFTHVAARQHVLASLEPLMCAIARVLLPQIAEAALGPRIAAEIRDLAAGAASPGPVVELAPGRAALFEDLPGAAIPEIVENPDLGPLEVRIRAGRHERHLDLGAAADRIGAAIRDFHATGNTERDTETERHG